MDRFFEFLLGLDSGFLSRPGDLSLQFNPDWPFQRFFESVGGASFFNLVLVLWGVALVVYVYRREGKSTLIRSSLAAVRLLLLFLILLLLNRPVLVLDQDRKEPSVLAVMVDDTLSMTVPDVQLGLGPPKSRIDTAKDLLTGNDAQLLNELAKVHDLEIYRFGRDAQPVASVSGQNEVPGAVNSINAIAANEDGTQVVNSLATVMQDLQGRRLAGVVILTDGKDVPVRERSEAINDLRARFPVGVWSVPLGQDALPKTLEIMKPEYEPSAFLDDYTVVKFSVRGAGFEAGHKVKVYLKTKKDDRPVLDEKGNPVVAEVTIENEDPQSVELSFMPALALGMDPKRLPAELPAEDRSLDLVVEAEKQAGQINPADSVRDVNIQVLDTQIRLLFVDGYPRWEYRYIKNSLVRDKTMKVNCLLTSADPSFVQEASDGVTPIREFPNTLDDLLQYDVVLFGDVDEHEFTDTQLQLINDFVSKRGGGFGMIAGPRDAPYGYKNTPIQPLLPVDISRTEPDDSETPITEGFRPVLTADGLGSSIFRFYPDKDANVHEVQGLLPPLFWYCHGIIARPQATVLSEHPTDFAPGSPRKAPLLVVSQYGAGRTLFSAVDDSWRWRFYTGEFIFDTYWVQQVRYLARNRKLDERNVTFEPSQSEFQLGTQASLELNVLNPRLSLEIPGQIPVDILDAQGRPVRKVVLNRLENSSKYTADWTADALGRFVARLPPMGDSPAMDRPFAVKSPQLELESPRLDRSLLGALGRMVELPTAREELPKLIRSVARVIPVQISRPIWQAPLALLLFVGLITSEWVLRKLNGML